MDLFVGVKLLPFRLANSQNEITISRFDIGHAMVVRPTIRPRCKSQSVEAEQESEHELICIMPKRCFHAVIVTVRTRQHSLAVDYLHRP